MKKCTVCGATKNETDFYWHKTYNCYASECKECTKERSKKYRKEHPDKIRATREQYKSKRKDIRYETDRKSYLRNKYNISEEDYKKMYNERNGCCEICGDKIEYRKLCIDHNHNTNKLRGMLCTRCNMALGLFSDNKTYLNNAIGYLERYDINE